MGGVVALQVMLVSALQLTNTFWAIQVTLEGITTLDNCEQLPKVQYSILSTPSGMVQLVRLVQS